MGSGDSIAADNGLATWGLLLLVEDRRSAVAGLAAAALALGATAGAVAPATGFSGAPVAAAECFAADGLFFAALAGCSGVATAF